MRAYDLLHVALMKGLMILGLVVVGVLILGALVSVLAWLNDRYMRRDRTAKASRYLRRHQNHPRFTRHRRTP
jgi:hypothetical protein